MKKIFFLFNLSVNLCIAQNPPAPILQTMISPINELLLARAKMSPQTLPQRESHEAEVARLTAKIKELEETIKEKDIQRMRFEDLSKYLQTELSKKDQAIEQLQVSLRNITSCAVNRKTQLEEQKAKNEELEALLDTATRTIASYEQYQQEQRKRTQEIIANGYKKLEQMRKNQNGNGILP